MWMLMSFVFFVAGVFELFTWTDKRPTELDEGRAIFTLIMVALSLFSLFLSVLYGMMQPAKKPTAKPAPKAATTKPQHQFTPRPIQGSVARTTSPSTTHRYFE